jgi:hypothetical protein
MASPSHSQINGDELISATKQKAIQLLGVNMAEAVHHEVGRLTHEQINRVFDMCLAVLTMVDNPALSSAELSLHTAAIKSAAWEHLAHLRGPHGTAWLLQCR